MELTLAPSDTTLWQVHFLCLLRQEAAAFGKPLCAVALNAIICLIVISINMVFIRSHVICPHLLFFSHLARMDKLNYSVISVTWRSSLWPQYLISYSELAPTEALDAVSNGRHRLLHRLQRCCLLIGPCHTRDHVDRGRHHRHLQSTIIVIVSYFQLHLILESVFTNR